MENYILRILVIHVIQTYREIPYKIESLFDIWRHFQRLRVFIFWTKKFIFVPISPKVPNIAECANIAEFFCKKTFGDIGPPVSWYH